MRLLMVSGMTNQPYTHAMHAARCAIAAQQGHVLASQRVQVQKQGVTYCASIKAAWTAPNGLDCWTVESTTPEVARFTVPCRKVLLCDLSDCTCAGGALDRAKLAPHEAEETTAREGVLG
jgi:hypothetical protein